jgi:PadR family transcriptional regulator, regulatory protein PadR
MKVPSLNQTEINILVALSPKELYGLEIVERVKKISEGEVSLSLGGLYTTLHRMETKGLIAGRWGESTEVRQGARRRYYKATGLGAKALAEATTVLKSVLRYCPEMRYAGAL